MTSTLSTGKKSGRWPCLTEPGGRRRLKRSTDGSRENRSRKLSHTRGLILPHAYCTIDVPNTWAVPNRTSFDRPRDHESQNRKAHFRVGRTCSEPWQGGGGGGPDGGVVSIGDPLLAAGLRRFGRVPGCGCESLQPLRDPGGGGRGHPRTLLLAGPHFGLRRNRSMSSTIRRLFPFEITRLSLSLSSRSM